MRLNVLALSYLFPNLAQPGYGIFVLNRLRAVSRYCHVKVIAPIQWYPFIRKLRSSFWSGDIPHHEQREGMDVFHPRFVVIPRYMKWLDALTFLFAASKVARNLRRDGYDYDVVDVHWTYPDVVAGWFLARRYGRKFGVTVRGHEALYDTEFTVRRWLVSFFLRRADFVVPLSEELAAKVVALGVDPKRVRVILNGVDLSHFSYVDAAAARNGLGLDPGRKVLLSVGRLTAGKRHDHLVRMMPALPQNTDVDLYIVGGVNPEDDFGHQLRKMIDELGLTNVHLVDSVSHEKLRLWYGAADVFCLATRGEGCPNVVLEALACGAPVVVTRVGAVEELVKQGINGMLVDLDADFGKPVAQALATQWDRRQIAERMRQWGWDACAQQVIKVYDAALSAELSESRN